MKTKWIWILLIYTINVHALAASPEAYFKEGEKIERQGQYFQAARYYYQALQDSKDEIFKSKVYGSITNALLSQGMYQSATYFFLKAVSNGDDRTIRNSLSRVEDLIENVGGVTFKKYLLKYTREDQFPKQSRDYYLHLLAQESLGVSKPHDVIRAVNDMNADFAFYPSALFLRGTANLLLNNIDAGIEDFKNCSDRLTAPKGIYKNTYMKQEIRELKNRCMAGIARGYYQAKNYNDADNWYDQIEMASLVWPQVQYERAWSSIARGDYNRALGRLVSYRSPGLSWYFDSEVEMLRTVSFLQMCIYEDVDKETIDFQKKYGTIGKELKNLLDSTASGNTKGIVMLFQKGIEAMQDKVQTEDPVKQVLNRFVRSPYFVQLAKTGDKVRKEINFLDGLGNAGKSGLGAFLRDVLLWRWQTAQEVGGMFVRDRLSTEYKILLNNIATVDIVKLEILRRQKSRMEKSWSTTNEGRDVWGAAKRGSLGRPKIGDSQYFWDFNGEFWADELGDYVFALRPECN